MIIASPHKVHNFRDQIVEKYQLVEKTDVHGKAHYNYSKSILSYTSQLTNNPK